MMKEHSLEDTACLAVSGLRAQQWVRRYLLVFAVALLAHFQMIANGLQNPDSIWLGSDFHIAGSWELSLGRWGLVLVDYLRGCYVSPILSGVGMLALYATAGLLLVEALEAGRGRLLRWLIPLTVVWAPQVLITESYLFCSIAYALAFLLAVTAALCVQRLPARAGVPLGALCLMASVSLYQSNVGVTAGLLLFWWLRTVLDTPDDRKLFFRRVVASVAAGGIGLAAYFLVLQIRLHAAQQTMAAYKGASSVGVLHSLANLGTGLPNAYRDFFQYFFGRSIAANYYQVRPAYAGLLVLALVALAIRLWKIRRRPAACLLAVVLVLLLPLAVALIDLIAPETTLILLTCSGMLTVVPFWLSLCGRYLPPVRPGRWAFGLAGVLAIVLLRGYLLQINGDSSALLASQRTTLTVGQSVLQDLQRMPAYQQGMPVTLQGQPENGNYPNLSPCYDKADTLIQMGLLFHSAPANSEGWQHILRQYLGVAPNWCTEAQVLDIVNTAEYQLMPIYPAEGSIQEIHGCLVVKIAG